MLHGSGFHSSSKYSEFGGTDAVALGIWDCYGFSSWCDDLLKDPTSSRTIHERSLCLMWVMWHFFLCFCWQVRSKAEAETLMRKIMRHQLRHGWPAERFRLFTSDAFGFYSSKMPSCCFLQGSQWRSKRAQVGKQRSVRHNFIDGKGHDQRCLANIPAVCRGCFIHSSRCIIKLYIYIYVSSDNLMHQIPQCHISYENLVWIAWAVLKGWKLTWPPAEREPIRCSVLTLEKPPLS